MMNGIIRDKINDNYWQCYLTKVTRKNKKYFFIPCVI